MAIIIMISKHSAFSAVSQSRESAGRMNNSLKIIQGRETRGERDCSPKADSATIINSEDTFSWRLFREGSPLDLIRKAKSTSYQGAYLFSCYSLNLKKKKAKGKKGWDVFCLAQQKYHPRSLQNKVPASYAVCSEKQSRGQITLKIQWEVHVQ